MKNQPTPKSVILAKVMMWINVIIALLVVSLGIYKYTAGSINTFSQAFIPFYLIMFGLLLVCAELEWLFLVKYFKFLDNFFGRGIYNVFLATMVMNAISQTFTDSVDNETAYIFTIIVSSLLVAVGALEMLFYIARCGGKSEKYQNYDKELAQQLIVQKQQAPLLQQTSPPIAPKITADPVPNAEQNPVPDQSTPQQYYTWLQQQMMSLKQQNPQLS